MVAPLAEDDTGPVKFTRFEATSGGMIEIVVGDVVVRAGGDVEARQDVFDYIEMFYNSKRKYVRNGMLSPIEFEKQQKI